MSKLLKDVFKKKRAKDLYVPTRAKVSRAPTMNIGRVPQTVKQKSVAKQRENVKKQFEIPSTKDILKDLKNVLQPKETNIELPDELKNYVQEVKRKQKNLSFIYERLDKNKIFDLNEFERVRSENGLDYGDAPTKMFLNDVKNVIDNLKLNKNINDVSTRCAMVLKKQFPKKSFSDVIQDKSFDKVEFGKFVLREIGLDDSSYEQIMRDVSLTADDLGLDDNTKKLMEQVGLYTVQDMRPFDGMEKNNMLPTTRTAVNKFFNIVPRNISRFIMLILVVIIFSSIIDRFDNNDSVTLSTNFSRVQLSDNSALSIEEFNAPTDIVANNDLIDQIWRDTEKGGSDIYKQIQKNWIAIEKNKLLLAREIGDIIVTEKQNTKSLGKKGNSVIKKNTMIKLSENSIIEILQKEGRILESIQKGPKIKSILINIAEIEKEVTNEDFLSYILKKFKEKLDEKMSLYWNELNRKTTEQTQFDILMNKMSAPNDKQNTNLFSFDLINYTKTELANLQKFDKINQNREIQRRADNLKSLNQVITTGMNNIDIYSKENDFMATINLNYGHLTFLKQIREFVMTYFEFEAMLLNNFTLASLGTGAIGKTLIYCVYMMCKIGWKKAVFGENDTHRSWYNTIENKVSYRTQNGTLTYILNTNDNPFESDEFKTDMMMSQQLFEKTYFAPFNFVQDFDGNFGRILPSSSALESALGFASRMLSPCLIYNNKERKFQVVQRRRWQGNSVKDDALRNLDYLVGTLVKLVSISNTDLLYETTTSSAFLLPALYFSRCFYRTTWPSIQEIEAPGQSENNVKINQHAVMFFSANEKIVKNVFDEIDNLQFSGERTIYLVGEEIVYNNLLVGPEIQALIHIITADRIDNCVLRWLLPFLNALSEINVQVNFNDQQISINFDNIPGYTIVDKAQYVYEKLKKLNYVKSNILIHKEGTPESLLPIEAYDTSFYICSSVFTEVIDQNTCYMGFDTGYSDNSNNIQGEGAEVNENSYPRFKAAYDRNKVNGTTDLYYKCFIEDVKENNKVWIIKPSSFAKESDFVYKPPLLFRNEMAACVIYVTENPTSEKTGLIADMLPTKKDFGETVTALAIFFFFFKTDVPGSNLVNNDLAIPSTKKNQVQQTYSPTIQEYFENFTPETAQQYLNNVVLTDIDLQSLERYFASMNDAQLQVCLRTLESLKDDPMVNKIVLLLEKQLESKTFEPFSGSLPAVCKNFDMAMYCLQNMDPLEFKILTQFPKAVEEVDEYIEKNGGIETILRTKMVETDVTVPQTGLQFDILFEDNDEFLRDNNERKTFVIRASIGDGLCLFHSVGQGVGMDAQELKEKLKLALRNVETYKSFDVREEKEKLNANDINNPSNYPGEISVSVLADILDITIKVYVILDQAQYVTSYNASDDKQIVHILNRRNAHYDFLQPIVNEAIATQEVSVRTRVVF